MTRRPVVHATWVLILAAFAMTVPAGTASGQVGGGVKAGVTLGDIPNASDALEAMTVVDSKQRIGFAAGAFVMVKFQNGFAIQPEFLYTQKGAKYDVAGTVGNAVIKIDFLDVPLLARYTFGKGVRGYLFGGPSFDFKLNAKAKTSGMPGSDEEDIGEDVKTFEFAVVFGGGVEFGPILFEARWSEGLTNLDAAPETGSPNIKTRTILFLAGLRF